jgi:hypothetical protein
MTIEDFEKANAYVTKRPSGGICIYIRKSFIENMSLDIFKKLDETFSLWSVWKVSIHNTHTGYEFTKSMCPETIARVFRSITKETFVPFD